MVIDSLAVVVCQVVMKAPLLPPSCDSLIYNFAVYEPEVKPFPVTKTSWSLSLSTSAKAIEDAVKVHILIL